MQFLMWLSGLIRGAESSLGRGPMFLAAFAGVVLLGRLVLRLSWPVIAAVLAAPALLFVVDHPYAESLGALDPRFVLTAAWIAALAGAVALRALYLLFKLLNPFSPRAVPLVAVAGGACLVLLFLVCKYPELLEAHCPGWRQTWGAAALTSAGAALVVSCFRCLRFVVPLVFWSAVFAGLAGYIAYDQNPGELWRAKHKQVLSYLEGRSR